jgi:diguanylate cyclase (GGDEF)-like protein/PAS domain S-box-containing protein
VLEKRPRILAIDDIPENLITLGAVLSPEYDLQFATSAAQGLAQARESRPDLILLDVMMPEMDGFETCRILRTDPLTREIPVIFLTALDSAEDETRGLETGAVDFISKPINPAIVRARIRTHLRIRQAESELRAREARFRTMIEAAHDGILLAEIESRRIVDANPTLCAMTGHDRHALLAMGLEDLHAPGDLAPALDNYGRQARGELNEAREAPIRRKDASVFHADVSVARMELDGRKYMACFFRDVSERKLAEEANRLAANVFTHAREGILITDRDANIINVNLAFTYITGFSREDVLGKNPRVLSSGQQGKEFYSAMWRDLRDKGHWYGEVWNRRKDGEVYAEMLTISSVRDEKGDIQNYIALFSDITALKEHESQLERIAHFDVLTGLPNRVLLADRLMQAMSQTRRRGLRLAVAYLDLDGFKAVNDTHGHEVGDQLLTTVAYRMKQSLRECDTISRIGGDEFVAVLLDLDDFEASLPMLTRLLNAAAETVRVGNTTLQVSASLGVTFYPQEEDVDADQLLRQADQAMYQAKLAGKNRYHIFDAALDRSVRGHHESRERIRQALIGEEFVLYYQPKVNMRTGQVMGVEALIRWRHPDRGLLSPAVFLPAIEEHPLAIELGEWVIDTALGQIESWHGQGLDIPVSVNVSARQLQHSDFVARLRALLAKHPRAKPEELELEVLETSALHDIAQVSRVMRACQELGVHFALDDFGTGYSSLTYLKRLPAQYLKIDQSFVRGMLDDPEDLAILEGVLGLATAFRRQAIAEGVETQTHGEMLLQLGCELAQGYFIAHPMPPEEIADWVASWETSPLWLNRPPISRNDLNLLFAAVEHRAWLAAIESCLRGETKNMPPLNHRHCRFGIWLSSEQSARLLAPETHGAIDALHRQVHALAEKLLDLKAQGNEQAALEGLTELYGLRDALLLHLSGSGT